MPIAVLAAVIAAVGSSGGATASVRSATCTAGTHSVGGATLNTYCGPAHATAKAGGKTFSFSGGQCAVSQGFFAVNIGTFTLPPVKPRASYFGIDVKPPKSGTHANQIVAWQSGGQGYSVAGATVIVNAGLTGGTFSGHLLTGGSASGSFSCG
jgi:hypothetical protein